MEKKKKCYNSGKITGLPYLTAYNNFLEGDRKIRDLGYEPVNPMEKRWLKPSAPWIMHMIVDIWKMMRCDAVAFQDNWPESRGARIEFKTALYLGKKIVYIPNE